MKISETVARYVELRSSLDAARKIYRDMEKEVKEEMDSLEMDILKVSDETGVDSFKTEFGTAYRVTKIFTAVEDRELLNKFVLETQDLGIFTNHLTKAHILELMDDGMIPQNVGIAYSEERAINFRKS